MPFMFLATLFLALGMGLLTTLRYSSRMALILGYQVPAGVGLGLALQQTVLAAQTILPIDDIPIGVSLMVLAQTLGGTIGLSAADTIFTSSLTSSIAKSMPQFDQGKALDTGATSLQKLIPPEYLKTVLTLYNRAVVKTWYLSLALSCASIIGVAGMEWKSMRPAPKPVRRAATDVDADAFSLSETRLRAVEMKDTDSIEAERILDD